MTEPPYELDIEGREFEDIEEDEPVDEPDLEEDDAELPEPGSLSEPPDFDDGAGDQK